MNGLNVIVRDSAAEAEDAFTLQLKLDPETIKLAAAADTGSNISDRGIDDLFTVDRLPAHANLSKSADQLLRKGLHQAPVTVRQVFERYCGSRDALTEFGNPNDIADIMEDWYAQEAIPRLDYRTRPQRDND